MRYSYILLTCFFALCVPFACWGQISDMLSEKLQMGASLSLKKAIVIKANRNESPLIKIHSPSPPYFMGTINFSSRTENRSRVFPIGTQFKVAKIEKKVSESRILNTQSFTFHLTGELDAKIHVSILVNQRFDEFLQSDDLRKEKVRKGFLQYFDIEDTLSADISEDVDP